MASLLGRRINVERNLVEYLVHWKGWGHIWDSWVLINDLHSDDMIKNNEVKASAGRDNLEGVLQSCGFFAPTLDKVVRYRNTHYFLVPYGMGRITQFCIIGPDWYKTAFKCKHAAKANTTHHLKHAQPVVQAIESGQFPMLTMGIILLNKNIHKHVLSADGKIGKTKTGISSNH